MSSQWSCGDAKAIYVFGNDAYPINVHCSCRDIGSGLNLKVVNAEYQDKSFRRSIEMIKSFIEQMGQDLSILQDKEYSIGFDHPSDLRLKGIPLNFDGDSFGLAISLAIISSTFKIEIDENCILTGSLANNNGDIGVVGDIQLKIESAMNTMNVRPKMLFPEGRGTFIRKKIDDEKLKEYHKVVKEYTRKYPKYIFPINNICEAFELAFVQESLQQAHVRISSNKQLLSAFLNAENLVARSLCKLLALGKKNEAIKLSSNENYEFDKKERPTKIIWTLSSFIHHLEKIGRLRIALEELGKTDSPVIRNQIYSTAAKEICENNEQLIEDIYDKILKSPEAAAKIIQDYIIHNVEMAQPAFKNYRQKIINNALSKMNKEIGFTTDKEEAARKLCPFFRGLVEVPELDQSTADEYAQAEISKELGTINTSAHGVIAYYQTYHERFIYTNFARGFIKEEISLGRKIARLDEWKIGDFMQNIVNASLVLLNISDLYILKGRYESRDEISFKPNETIINKMLEEQQKKFARTLQPYIGTVTEKKDQPIRGSYIFVDRDGPCPCGSGKKYKECCYPKFG